MLVNLKQVREWLNAARRLVNELESAENHLLYPTTDYTAEKTVYVKDSEWTWDEKRAA